MLAQATFSTNSFIHADSEHDWQQVCMLDDIIRGTGVAVRLNGKQLAVFNSPLGLWATGNLDPFSGANVLSRGLLGDMAGEPVVASPVYKQHFCLRTGRCLEDPEVSVPVYPLQLCRESGRVYVRDCSAADVPSQALCVAGAA